MPGGALSLDNVEVAETVVWGPVVGGGRGGVSFPPLTEISRMTWGGGEG